MTPLTTIGAAASAGWAREHGLDLSTTPHWYVEICVPTDNVSTRFEINIYPEEWGVVYRRGDRVSSIRVTDVPFIHGFDDHHLLTDLPELPNIHELITMLEGRDDVTFHRTRATVRSNLTRVAAVVRPWLIGRRSDRSGVRK